MSKVVLFGDVGVDRYHVGRVRGLSAEAPIPIIDVTGELTLPAMGGNVAANLVALGVDITGPAPSIPVPVKHRLITEDGQQLARWDEKDLCAPIQTYDAGQYLDDKAVQAVIICDYGKGAIHQDLIEYLCGKCDDRSLFLLVDTKRDPYEWMHEGIDQTVFFPNAAEYARYEAEYGYMPNVLLKRGAEGVATVSYGEVQLEFPSLATRARCVNGAGDTVLAAFTTGLVGGLGLIDCVRFASVAAAVVVEQPFNERTPNMENLLNKWSTYGQIQPRSHQTC